MDQDSVTIRVGGWLNNLNPGKLHRVAGPYVLYPLPHIMDDHCQALRPGDPPCGHPCPHALFKPLAPQPVPFPGIYLNTVTGVKGVYLTAGDTTSQAVHPPHVQSYSVKAFGPFFTWVYHAEDAAVTSLDKFEKMDTPVTMNQLKFLQGMYEPSLLQQVAADMSGPKTNIKEIQDRASAYRSSSGSIGIREPRREALSIRPEVCSPHKQVGKHANKVSATFRMFREASPAEKVPLQDWDAPSIRCTKEGPYQDRPPLCPFRLSPLLTCS